MLYPVLHGCSSRFSRQPLSVRSCKRQLSSYHPSAPVRSCLCFEQVLLLRETLPSAVRNCVSVCLFAMLWLQYLCVLLYYFSIVQKASRRATMCERGLHHPWARRQEEQEGMEEQAGPRTASPPCQEGLGSIRKEATTRVRAV